MAQKLSVEETLARLGKLTKTSFTESEMKDIQKALSSANNVIVAKAAKVVADGRLISLLPQLIQAFERFMNKPAKTDKGCFAKIAIVEALDVLQYPTTEIFRQGIRHVQMEPIYGGQQDTAANLRAKCALALARREVVDIFFELIPLLTDPEPQPRLDAVKALTYLNEEKSELLLRLKVLTGDAEPQVLSECFAGLMSIAPERSTPFVAGFLSATDLMLAEGAALALGESHCREAFSILRNCWEDAIEQDVKTMLLLPMALSRCEEAFNFLLDVVRDEYRAYAAAAVSALKVYINDVHQRQKIQQAVKERDEPMVSDIYTRVFEDM
jgi:hypothetical protein